MSGYVVLHSSKRASCDCHSMHAWTLIPGIALAGGPVVDWARWLFPWRTSSLLICFQQEPFVVLMRCRREAPAVPAAHLLQVVMFVRCWCYCCCSAALWCVQCEMQNAQLPDHHNLAPVAVLHSRLVAIAFL